MREHPGLGDGHDTDAPLTQRDDYRRDEDRRKITEGTFTFDDIAGYETAAVIEVGALFRADQRTIRARIKDGKIPAIDLGGEWRIPVRWIAEQLRVPA